MLERISGLCSPIAVIGDEVAYLLEFVLLANGRSVFRLGEDERCAGRELRFVGGACILRYPLRVDCIGLRGGRGLVGHDHCEEAVRREELDVCAVEE